MKRLDRKRLEALQKVLVVSQALAKDIEIASEIRLETIKSAKPTENGKLESAYSGKTVLRALFSHMDGLAYIMRFVADEYAPELGVQISSEERAALLELRSTKDGKPPQPRLHPLEHLKWALQIFPSLFGIEHELDLSSDSAKAFRSLMDIRNRMVHPTMLEHLSGADIHPYWIPGSSWYLKQVNNFLAHCARQIPDSGLTFPEPAPPGGQPVESGAVDSTGAAEPVKSLRTREHTEKAIELLVGDTSRAMGVSTRMAGKDDLQAMYGQFGMRNLVRTVFAEAEVTVALLTYVLSESEEWSGLAMTDQDLEDLRGSFDLDQKLLGAINLWSAERGEQKERATGGKKWDFFRQALRLRDRLTYPKAPKEMRVNMDDASVILGAQDWIRELSILLVIDPAKWPKAPLEPAPLPEE